MIEPIVLNEPLQLQQGGEVMPGWRVERVLGEGGQACVYKVVHGSGATKIERALKVLPFDQAHAELVEHELEAMVKLQDHPNVVRIEDFSLVRSPQSVQLFGLLKNYEENLLIRMELLTPLDAYWKSAPQPEEVVEMAIQILDALILMQQHKMIHRDIKPGNIMVTPGKVFKLSDYGLARVVEEGRAKSILGTPLFMAPEILTMQGYDQTVDYYALGMTMYVMLNNGEGPSMQVKNVVAPLMFQMAPANSSSITPIDGLDRGLFDILCKACALNPRDRYQTAEEFQKALKAWRSGGAQAQPQAYQRVNLGNTKTSMDAYRQQLEQSMNNRRSMVNETLDNLLSPKNRKL